MPKVPMRLLLVGCAMLGSTACAGAPPIVTMNAAGCASLLPAEWREGVAGADLPDGDTVGDWIVFADAQTGRLDQANGRTRDAIAIVEACEARHAAAVATVKKRGLLARLGL